jgi:hypothetical protein
VDESVGLTKPPKAATVSGMIGKILGLSLGLLALTTAVVVAQTANDLNKLHDDLAQVLKAKAHWSLDANASFSLALREAPKPLATPNPTDGSTLVAASANLLFGRLPDGVTANEVWAFQAQKDAKGKINLVSESVRQIGATELRGLRLPSKNETLLAVFKTLRNPDTAKQALPYADKIIQAWYVDAFKDPANPALDERLEIRKDAEGTQSIWFGTSLSVLFDHEYFKAAPDNGYSAYHLRSAAWFQVRFERPAGGDWRPTADAWQPLAGNPKPSVIGGLGGRYKIAVEALFKNLLNDGIDAIFGDQTAYTSALAHAADWRLAP